MTSLCNMHQMFLSNSANRSMKEPIFGMLRFKNHFFFSNRFTSGDLVFYRVLICDETHNEVCIAAH